LRSYTEWDDHEYDEAGLEELAAREAKLRLRYRLLQREGRTVIDSEQMRLFHTTEDGEISTAIPSTSVALADKISPQDTWSEIIRLVALKREQTKKPNALVVTAACVKALRSKWDAKAKNKAKVRMEEEKMAKSKAKDVLKLVLEKWGEVVTVSSVPFSNRMA
jgi:hypothetical protein